MLGLQASSEFHRVYWNGALEEAGVLLGGLKVVEASSQWICCFDFTKSSTALTIRGRNVADGAESKTERKTTIGGADLKSGSSRMVRTKVHRQSFIIAAKG